MEQSSPWEIALGECKSECLSFGELQLIILENEIQMLSPGNAFADWDGKTLSLLKSHQIEAEGKCLGINSEG